jgi:hypothetical protein
MVVLSVYWLGKWRMTLNFKDGSDDAQSVLLFYRGV